MKLMSLVEEHGIPLAVYIAGANVSEVSLAVPTLATLRIPAGGRGRPQTRVPYVIADKAYDSDPLRFAFRCRGMELICQNRANRVTPSLQKKELLGKTKRRWIVERSFAWYQKFRRLVVRYETTSSMYLAFVHLACLMITLEQF
jgi:transposase